MGTTTLILPGWNGSGPAHWQTLWEREHPHYRRVQQKEWNDVRCTDWVETIDDAIAGAAGRVVLVAHSLACVAVAAWADRRSSLVARVECAFLVAPPDLDGMAECPSPLRSFAPVPRRKLPFRSLLVGSENDPYMTSAGARDLASAWGSAFANAGAAGHINVNSGHGPWPQGARLLASLMAGRAVDGGPLACTHSVVAEDQM
jgi:predicted alpha/beta hydrolase family esterase